MTPFSRELKVPAGHLMGLAVLVLGQYEPAGQGCKPRGGEWGGVQVRASRSKGARCVCYLSSVRKLGALTTTGEAARWYHGKAGHVTAAT